MFEELKNIKPTESALVTSAPFWISLFTVCWFPFSDASFKGVCPYYKKRQDKNAIELFMKHPISCGNKKIKVFTFYSLTSRCILFYTHWDLSAFVNLEVIHPLTQSLQMRVDDQEP